MDNPCTNWLSDNSWDNITELDKLTNFHGIITSFEQYPRDWNLWYTSAEPETTSLPGDATDALVHLRFLSTSSSSCARSVADIGDHGLPFLSVVISPDELFVAGFKLMIKNLI